MRIFIVSAWRKFPYLTLVLGAALLFVPFLGRVHLFDWDELIFAEAAREMLLSDNYAWIRINFQPFWEKPPLFFWLQAASMRIFGVGEFAARLPNACCGILSLCLLYYLGKKFANPRVATLWVLSYATSILPHFYFKTGIIDPWFNLFIFAALAVVVQYFCSQRLQYALLAGAILGLATLTKGPVAVFLTAICTGILSLWSYKNLDFRRLLIHALYALLLCMAVISLWILPELYSHGTWFVQTFWAYQSSLLTASYGGHRGFWGYHLLVLALGCFPAAAWMWNSGVNRDKLGEQARFRLMMMILLLVVVLVFSIVQTKLVHYSALAYFPISFLAALGMARYLECGHIAIGTKIHLIIGGLFWAGLSIVLPLILHHKAWLIQNIADVFVRGNLQAEVDWGYALSLWGLAYLGLWVYGLWIARNLRASFEGAWRVLLVQAGASLLLIQVIFHLWTPRVERMLQGAAIEFWQAQAGKDCYVETLYMKSFAPYFYAKVKSQTSGLPYYDSEWLLKGKIDKTAYLLCKNIHKSRVLQEAGEGLQLLYEKNGYCFWKREPAIAY